MQAINTGDDDTTVELRGTVKISYEGFQKIPYDGLGHHLISGVHIITPAPSIIHQQIVGRIFRLLSDHIDKEHLGEVLISPIDVKFSEEDGLQPDLIYIKTENISIINKNFVNGTPDIIVEVISPGSIKIDRGWKKSTAEQYGVAEYWLINSLDDEVEIYTHNGKKYEQSGHFNHGDMIVSRIPEFSNLIISVENIFQQS